MIFSINVTKSILIKALAHIQTIVERRNVISVLGNVKIAADSSGLLELTATDMAIIITEKIQVQVTTPGEFTVSAHMLFDIVRKLDENFDVQLTIAEDAPTILNISSGKSHFALSTLPAKDFPVIDSDNFSHNFTISTNRLKEVIDKTKFAICNEDTRYNLNGMHLNFDGTLNAVTTDGHRLSIVQINEVSDLNDFPQIIIPKKTVIELRKIIDESKENIKISLSSRKIQFICNNITMISKLVDAKFPDYAGLVPHNNQLKVEVDAKLFAKAIDRVSTINDEKFKGIKLFIEQDIITFTANSDLGGSGKEIISINSNVSEKVEIGFNARYLLEGMTVITGEKVLLSLKDGFSSILIEDSDDKSFKYILMPMRI
jgi:DNA polymerase-3 subunit beta